MNLSEIREVRKELERYLEEFKPLIGRSERMHWCQQYLCGLMLNGERKSIQPLAERIPGGNEQNMQQFVNQSPWETEPVLKLLNEKMLKETGKSDGILVLDDTSFPKKGKHSVGVARLYCGALGKIANCQSLVSWHYAGSNGHWPITGELFLPDEWTKDKERMGRCGVPERRYAYRKKWELALELYDRMGLKDMPHEAIVFDAGYGEIGEFTSELDNRGEKYIGRIPESHAFWSIDTALTHKNKNKLGRPRIYPVAKDKSKRPLKAKQWTDVLKKNYGWKTISVGTANKKRVKAISVRVYRANSNAYWRPGESRWLIIEQDGKEVKYYESNFPEGTTLKRMMRIIHRRWTVEQGYQQLKEELGLDHFEGRSWRGLHHHMTLAFMAYCFLQHLRSKGGLKKGLHYQLSRRSESGSMDCLQPAGVQNAIVGSARITGYSSTQGSYT